MSITDRNLQFGESENFGYLESRKSNFRYSNRNFPLFRLTFLGTIPHLETHPGRRSRVTTTSLLDTHICWTTGCKAAVEHASKSEFQHLNSLSPWFCLKLGTPKWQSEEGTWDPNRCISTYINCVTLTRFKQRSERFFFQTSDRHIHANTSATVWPDPGLKSCSNPGYVYVCL